MSLIIPANTLASGGFDVANSCRFNDDDSAYMHKTPGGAGNRRTFTISAWVKRGQVTTTSFIFGAWTADNDAGHFAFGFTSAEQLTVDTYSTNVLTTNRLFRDPSAWYHVVCAIDTTNGTANNRVRLYVNGVEETSFANRNNPSQNADLQANNAVIQAVGTNYYNSQGNVFYDGYMAEFCMIDNQQLTPTSFGEFDEDSGIWKPIDVSGLTFGTNGFYLDFKDSANLGNDANGGTDLTEVNLAAIDQTTDTPTNNFCTLNPLDVNSDGVHTLSDGNLTAVNTAESFDQTRSTYYLSTGKWFWEFKCTRVPTDGTQVGVVQNNYAGGSGERRNYQHTGSKYSGSSSSYGATWTINDIIGIALDLDNGTITFYKNGASQGVAFTDLLTSIDDTGWTPVIISYNGDGSFNFGNPPYAISSGNTDGNSKGNFEYAVPSGYLSLCTANLSEVLG